MNEEKTPSVKHTGDSYAGKAAKYAATVDTKPWNAFYERPGMMSLMPDLAGKLVLDAGCGSGWYAEQFLAKGARVVSVDLDPEFVSITKRRIGKRAMVLQADLAKPLSFASTAEFDAVVAPLVLHYLRDWIPTLREFRRVMKPGGILLFSTHHPFMDWKFFQKEDYFAVDLCEDEWEIGKVRFYRRPLTRISADLEQAGFLIERLLEIQPTEEFEKADPAGYRRLRTNPHFLAIRASVRRL